MKRINVLIVTILSIVGCETAVETHSNLNHAPGELRRGNEILHSCDLLDDYGFAADPKLSEFDAYLNSLAQHIFEKNPDIFNGVYDPSRNYQKLWILENKSIAT